MPKYGNLRPGTGVLLAACALLATAPARADVGEVHLGIQYGLIYLPVDHVFGGAHRPGEARNVHGENRGDQDRADIVAGCVLSLLGNRNGS